MSGQETTTAESAAAGPGRRPAIGSRSPGSSPGQTAARRPWWIWVAPFTLVLAVLVVRSRFLFTASFYEQGDAGANSILIQQAMHGTLLIGNYSREGFNHPGPAYMYVQAAGQWLFLYALHLVPTAWNAHVLAVFVLNSAFVAMVTGMVYGWTRSLRGAGVALAVLLGFVATEPLILSLDWMAWMYVPTYIAFLVAAASVAAGAARDLWILALTGWFLIHGHACFLFFVPVILAAVLAAVIWQHGPRASLRAFLRPRTWIPVAVISAVFALPIVVNLALHWPGSFGKYFSYSSSSRAGGHGLTQVVRYALWFWWHGGGHTWVAALVPVASYAVAIAGVWWLTHGAMRRFLAALLAVNVVSTVAFVCYAAVGIDYLTEYYIGYFYWSVPTAMLLIVALGVIQALPVPWLRAAIAVVAAVSLFAWIAFVVTLRTGTHDNTPSLPATVAADAARAHGQPLILDVQGDAWPLAVGFLLQAERSNVSACVTNPSGAYLVILDEFPCAPHPSGYHIAIGS